MKTVPTRLFKINTKLILEKPDKLHNQMHWLTSVYTLWFFLWKILAGYL